jgi:hypothetical protein
MGWAKFWAIFAKTHLVTMVFWQWPIQINLKNLFFSLLVVLQLMKTSKITFQSSDHG